MPPYMHIQILLTALLYSHVHIEFLNLECAQSYRQPYPASDSCKYVKMHRKGAWEMITWWKKSVYRSSVRQQASMHLQYRNFGDRQLRPTCFLKLARPLQLFCTILSLQQASMQILSVAPYVDTPAPFNVKTKLIRVSCS